MPDIQAGVDSSLWILWTALSGADFGALHLVSRIRHDLPQEMVVIYDEIIGFVRRLISGIDITPETLALDVIDEVGPGGDYVSTDHTLRHLKECWYPSIFDRLFYRSWTEAGHPTANENARLAAREAIRDHSPEPIPEATLETLHGLVAAADGRGGRQSVRC